MKRLTSLVLLLALLCTLLGGCIELDDDAFAYDSQSETEESFFGSESVGESDEQTEQINGIPTYSGKKYVTVNSNVPYFTKDTVTAEAYEFYSELDSLAGALILSKKPPSSRTSKKKLQQTTFFSSTA